MSLPTNELIEKLYPEAKIGGFSSIDGTVEFYNRVNALINPEMHVLDYGAGRGCWLSDKDRSPYVKKLQLLKGKIKKIVGVDIDKIVLTNKSLDSGLVIKSQESLPFQDDSFDIIISDWAFEHVEDPKHVISELMRVLKPGGWICARTTNRLGYVALGAKLIPGRIHGAILKVLQPDKNMIDNFKTYFKMNTLKTINNLFNQHFNNFSYTYEAEPLYFGNSILICRIMKYVHMIIPKKFKNTIFIFLQNKK